MPEPTSQDLQDVAYCMAEFIGGNAWPQFVESVKEMGFEFPEERLEEIMEMFTEQQVRMTKKGA